MCGICGIVDFSGSPIAEETLWSMTKTLTHRGPDDRGIALLDNVGLGHTRLSIIDLSPTGHQPMRCDDGNLTLVYNGELYNFQELRRRLDGDGFRFKGTCDTEVVLNAYRRWGMDAFVKFNGMFGLAVWDSRARRLQLARDRFGIKPLYYSVQDGWLVFGSEIKAMLASGRLKRTINWQALHEYLYYGNALGSNTLFDGVVKLLPGHCLTFSAGGCTVAPYWSMDEVEPVRDTVETAAAGVRERLTSAVGAHLQSDVPVGVFLSGGVDSSAITALASRQYGGRLNTYSVGFDFDKGVNELPRARLVAERFGTEHHELHVAGANLPEVIETLVRCHDSPFADSANIPLYLLCERLKGSVKVILQGDGGDEIFAGYRRYNVVSNEWFWRPFSRLALPLAGGILRGPAYYRMTRFLKAMGNPEPVLRTALLLTSEWLDSPPTRVLAADAQRTIAGFDPFARYRELDQRFRRLDRVQRLLYIDSSVILPDTYLEKVDKPTMAHSIEVRVPFLDVDLTSYALGLPSGLKVRRGQKKWILRKALREVLPDAILDGAKRGFGVPIHYWMQGPLAGYLRSVVLDQATLDWGLFDRAALERCIDEHVAGRRNDGFLLHKLLNLALWRRFYLDRQ